jgi:hypothetical protein
MRVRFQADADLDGRIIRGLRRVAPEIDIRTAADAGLADLKDPEVLRIAALWTNSREPGSADDACTFRSLRVRCSKSRRYPATRSDSHLERD